MLNLGRLHLLHELSILGSISAVATAMNLTRPAVSQQLALLEREAGATLFERSVRGTRLTQTGERIVAKVADILQSMNALEADLASSSQEVSGELRMAAFGSVASTVVPRATTQIKTSHPSLRIFFEEMEPYEGLRAAAAKQVDIAIVDDLIGTETFATSLEFRPLLIDRFVAVLSVDHRLWTGNRKLLHLEDLSQERWSMNRSASGYVSFVTNACHAEGFSPDVDCSSRNLVATLEFVRTGHYVTVLPELATTSIENDPDFCIIPVRPTLVRRIFCAYAKGNRDRPSIAAALAALEKASSVIATLSGIKLNF